MLVKNKKNTSNESCDCDSWLQHWEKGSGKKSTYCHEKGCIAKVDLVGAHILKVNSSDTKTYIVPLCKSHNGRENNFEISPYNLISPTKDICKK